MQQISDNIRLLAQIIHDIHEPNCVRNFSLFPLSLTQIHILRTLYNAGPKASWELAEMFNISRAAISQSVNKLVRRQLVRRKQLHQDRRTIILTIRKAGIDFLAAYDQYQMEIQSQILSGFSGEEQDQFNHLLEKYIHKFLEHEKNVDFICLQCNGTYREECAISRFRGACYFQVDDSLVTNQ